MNRCLLWLVATNLVLVSAPAFAQLHGEKASNRCIAVQRPDAAVRATGRLTLRHLPGPPNFESIRQGDQDRLTFILILPWPTCIDDGGYFANPKARFRTVHVWTLDSHVHRKLRSLVGKTVTVIGNGYAANNALHYAPLVVEVKSVIADSP
jgi:hypothetical protein